MILNLGAEVASSGRVPDDLLDRALHTVARFRDIAERSGAEAIWPVATSAFRDAANQPWLSKALRGALGVPVRILGGDEEVQCTVSGIRASVALPDEPWVAFDLGGGSLEIALVEGEAIRWSDSFPLGAARLARTMVEHDPMTRTERRELRRLVKETVAPAVAACTPVEHPTCIIAGGTAGALARLLAARRWPAPPTSLNQFAVGVDSLAELSRSLEHLLARGAPRPARDRRAASRSAARRLGRARHRAGAGRREQRRPQRVGAARGGCAARARRPHPHVARAAASWRGRPPGARMEHRRRPLGRGPSARGPAVRRDARVPRSRRGRARVARLGSAHPRRRHADLARQAP